MTFNLELDNLFDVLNVSLKVPYLTVHFCIPIIKVNDAGSYVNRTSKLKKTPVEDAVLPSPPFVNRQLKPHRINTACISLKANFILN